MTLVEMEANALPSPPQIKDTEIFTPVGFHSHQNGLKNIESTQSLHNLTLQLAEDTLDSDLNHYVLDSIKKYVHEQIQYGPREYDKGCDSSCKNFPNLRYKEFDVILSGGGLKGYYFSGAGEVLKALEATGEIRIRQWVGTSAGAISAVWLACDMDPHLWRKTYYWSRIKSLKKQLRKRKDPDSAESSLVEQYYKYMKSLGRSASRSMSISNNTYDEDDENYSDVDEGELSEEMIRNLSLSSYLSDAVEFAMRMTIKEDAWKVCSGRVRIMTSVWKNFKWELRAHEHFKNNDELIDAVIASLTIPFLSVPGWRGRLIRGELHYDGGFAEYGHTPILENSSVPQLVIPVHKAEYPTKYVFSVSDDFVGILCIRGAVEMDHFLRQKVPNRKYLDYDRDLSPVIKKQDKGITESKEVDNTFLEPFIFFWLPPYYKRRNRRTKIRKSLLRKTTRNFAIFLTTVVGAAAIVTIKKFNDKSGKKSMLLG